MASETADREFGTETYSDDNEENKMKQVLDRISYSCIPSIGAVSHTAFAVHILNRPMLPR